MENRTLRLWEKAQQEAQKADWLWTAPNPRVGALALKGGHIIGRGYHHSWGGAHAEEMALRDAGAWNLEKDIPIAGLVDEMVVTLEPCSSAGKRPACVTLLEKAKIESVVVGALDPNPQHQGVGLSVFKKLGIQVSCLSQEETFNQKNHLKQKTCT